MSELKNNNLVLMFCGLMGTGKTTFSKYFAETFSDYIRINSDDVRRLLGKKFFDIKDVPEINAYVYSTAEKALAEGKGVIFDSALKLKSARENPYKVARNANVPALVIECKCSPETSINRMSQRKKEDDLHTPTNDPKVYHDYAKMWEDPLNELDDEDKKHVSLITIDSDKNELKIVKVNDYEQEKVVQIINLLKEGLEYFR